MSVFKGSRYENCKYTAVVGKDGKVRRFLHPREPLTLSQMTDPLVNHVVQKFEELDLLAWRAAGKPRLWWIIADVNNVLFPLDPDPGSELTVPVQDLQNRSEFG